MANTLSKEQKELRSVVRAFLARASSEVKVRAAMATDSGFEPSVWAQLNDQLAVQGMLVPERHGGSGFTHVDFGVVLEEAGRVLLGAPLLSSALVIEALLASADATGCEEILPRLAARREVGTVALLEAPGAWAERPVATRAELTRAGWVLNGRKVHVIDAGSSALLVVSADVAGQTGMFLVESPTPGLTITPVPTLDQTRKQAHVDFDNVAARLLAHVAAGADILDRVRSAGATYLAVEQVGGAQFALEMAVAYSLARTQYGRPIGSFQAIKHLCADVLTSIETARSAAFGALRALDRDDAELPLLASAAKVFCSDAYTAAAAACVQVHGAIGFTWEHPAHLYFKRAKSSQVLFGAPSLHRDLIARGLGL